MLNTKMLLCYSVLIIITRCLDGYTTYLATPDLSYELNPIVRSFSGNWFLLLIVGAIFTTLLLMLFFISYRNQDCLFQTSDSLKAYYRQVFKVQKLSSFNFSYKLLVSKPTIVFLGLSIPITLGYYSIFLIMNNLFIWGTYRLKAFYNFFLLIHKFHELIIIVVALLVYLIVANNLLRKGYLVCNNLRV